MPRGCPCRKWARWGCFLDEVFLPPHLDQHVLHVVRDPVIAVLAVAGGVTLHIAHADADLLRAQRIDGEVRDVLVLVQLEEDLGLP